MATLTPWTADEINDLELSWADFSVAHPGRTYDAWRVKRAAHRKTLLASPYREPEAKVAPIVETLLPDDHAEALLSAEGDAALFRAYLAYHDEVTRSFPFQEDVSVRLPVREPIALAVMSDWHIGSEGTDLRRLEADVQLIASHPRLYCGLGGDVCDNFILDKMASAARSQTAQVQVQWRLFRYLMQPLLESKSLLWVSSGNHDQWTNRVAAIDPLLAALGDIPVSYIGEGGYVDLTVGEQTYTVWRKHKPTRFNSSFNRGHFLKQMMRVELPREFDIGISEHVHDPETAVWAYRGKERALLAAGTYKVRDRFSESIGFYSGGYGVPCVVLYPHERLLIPVSSIRAALELLDGVSRGKPGAAQRASRLRTVA